MTSITATLALSHLDHAQPVNIEAALFQKMALLYNAVESGWSIKKRGKSYVFTKKHENKREVLDDAYLETFIRNNLDIHLEVE